MDRQNLGIWGESLVAGYLERKGWQVIERGWRAGRGEIDLIALDGNEVVFIEVKTRAGMSYGSPEEAITPFKQRQLRALAMMFINRERQYANSPFRIDVIAVQKGLMGEKTLVRHYRSAV